MTPPQWTCVDTRPELPERQLAAQSALLSQMAGYHFPGFPGLAFVGEYLGRYNTNSALNFWGKSSPYFLPSPDDNLPAVALTVGAWLCTIDNQTKQRREAECGGVLHAFVDDSWFRGLNHPPVDGNHIHVWYWSPTTLKHHAEVA